MLCSATHQPAVHALAACPLCRTSTRGPCARCVSPVSHTKTRGPCVRCVCACLLPMLLPMLLPNFSPCFSPTSPLLLPLLLPMLLPRRGPRRHGRRLPPRRPAEEHPQEVAHRGRTEQTTREDEGPRGNGQGTQGGAQGGAAKERLWLLAAVEQHAELQIQRGGLEPSSRHASPLDAQPHNPAGVARPPTPVRGGGAEPIRCYCAAASSASSMRAAGARCCAASAAPGARSRSISARDRRGGHPIKPPIARKHAAARGNQLNWKAAGVASTPRAGDRQA